MGKSKGISGLTSNEKRFNALVESGISFYKRAIEAKSLQNTVKHGQNCISEFENAIQVAKLIEEEKKLPFIYEYIVLAYGVIGTTYFERKDWVNSIEPIQNALTLNENTPKNEDSTIRTLYFLSKLMHITILQENWEIAGRYALRMYPVCKTLKDPIKSLEYLFEVKDVFIKTKNLDMINATYKTMLKISKKHEKNKEIYKSAADVYFDYGNYLEIVMKKLKKSKEYFEKALQIYKTIQVDALVNLSEQRIAQLEK